FFILGITSATISKNLFICLNLSYLFEITFPFLFITPSLIRKSQGFPSLIIYSFFLFYVFFFFFFLFFFFIIFFFFFLYIIIFFYIYLYFLFFYYVIVSFLFLYVFSLIS